MKRTTIYLTDEQKRELGAIAGSTQRTEAQLIREGVDHVIDRNRERRRKPRTLFSLSDPMLDDPARIDEALDGFGSG